MIFLGLQLPFVGSPRVSFNLNCLLDKILKDFWVYLYQSGHLDVPHFISIPLKETMRVLQGGPAPESKIDMIFKRPDIGKWDRGNHKPAEPT